MQKSLVKTMTCDAKLGLGREQRGAVISMQQSTSDQMNHALRTNVLNVT